jgi:cobalt-precorrin 5A hydrolase
VHIFIDADNDCELPDDFKAVDSADRADIILSYSTTPSCEHPEALALCPPILFLGLGCNRGAVAADFEQAFTELCLQHRLHRHAIVGIASIDLKENEAGLLQFASDNNLPISFYSAKELNRIEGLTLSSAVLAATGAYGVAEPAAMLAAGSDDAEGKPGKLIVRKIKWKDVTAAVAVRQRVNLTTATTPQE